MAKRAVKRKRTVKRAVSIRQMANDLATIKENVAAIRVDARQTRTTLNSFFRMAARAPSGRTLINLVEENNTILHRLR